MATEYYDITDDYADGVTPYAATDIERVHKVLDSQLNAALRLWGAGVWTVPDANSFKVTAGAGLSVSIAAGLGITQDATHGGVALAKATATTLGSLDASSTLYIYATAEDAANKSFETALPLFVASDLDDLEGGLLLAEVTTGVATVSAVVDLRRMLTPLINRGTYAATMPYKTHDKVKYSGSWWIALVDNVGVTPAEGATWTQDGGASSSGAAGGVLSGSYPNPGFAADMATQAELDAHIGGAHTTAQPLAIQKDGVAVGTKPTLNLKTGANMTLNVSVNGQVVDATFAATQTPGYGGTSTTSLTIGTGSKSFTTQAGMAYVIGSRVRLANSADTTQWMEGVVTAYTGTSMTVNVDATGGSGTIATWNLSIAGGAGATGAAGPSYGGTSTDSESFSTGSKVYTTQAGLAYTVGARVRATLSTDTTKWQEGAVTDYTGTALTILVDRVAPGASGTVSSWVFNVAGEPGPSDHGDLTGLDGDDHAQYPLSGAESAEGRWSLISAARAFLTATISGTTALARWGKFATGNAHWSHNLSFDGTDWNLDDTAADGHLLSLGGASPFRYRKATAGANPRTLADAQIPLEYGGTEADLSATGGTGHVVKQASAGAAFTVGALAASELPDHVSEHISGGGDAFLDTDLLEAIVKRLRVDGPVDLLLGAVADGDYLKRDGTAIVGDTPAGGGGGAVVQIAQTVLGSAAASITFSSIAGSYEDLVITFTGRGDAVSNAINLLVRFNGDTAGNYDYSATGANVSTPQAFEGNGVTSILAGNITAASAVASSPGVAHIIIPGYARTVFHKTLISSNGFKHTNSSGGPTTYRIVGWWRNTAAITSITLLNNSGNFITGTVATLWGRT